jgi:hypothetical protein
MNPMLRRLAYPVRNRKGIAFPVALLGILGVSVTITAVLLAATTESALSSAHQDATRDLYVAQGGLEAYVAQAGMVLAPVTNLPFRAPGAPPADETLITVRQLGSAAPQAPGIPANAPRDLFFSIQAEPIRGGRTIGAIARIMTTNLNLVNNVKAALVSGSNVTIGGNTTVSNTTDAALCHPDSAAKFAIQHDSANAITKNGNPTINGGVGKLGSDTDGYLKDMIGASLTDLKNNATVKFAKGQFGNTRITSFGTNNTPNVANLTQPQNTPYNWGCPADLLRLASNNNSNALCELDSDTTHMPIIAIDAMNANGTWGEVRMNLDHGQGILVVYNGGLDIQGQLAFKGLIIVEGAFKITGAGNNGARFEGSVIGLGKNGGGSTVTEDPNSVGGTPTIRYNRCAVNSVLQVFNNQPTFTQVVQPTSAWYEVVR